MNWAWAALTGREEWGSEMWMQMKALMEHAMAIQRHNKERCDPMTMAMRL